MFEGGSITVAHVRGAPLRVHRSTALGAFVFTRFSINPLVWIGFFRVVLVDRILGKGK